MECKYGGWWRMQSDVISTFGTWNASVLVYFLPLSIFGCFEIGWGGHRFI